MAKCAFISGASSGIGRGIALRLAEAGYDIAFTYYAGSLRAAEENRMAAEVKAEIEQRGQRAFCYEADLRDADAPQRVVDMARRDLGAIDALIANAGIDGRHSVLTATAKEMDDFFHLNMRSAVLLTGAAARHMIRDKTEHGNVIFITSSRAERAYADDFLYGMTKAALKRACESIAIDLSPYGIRVNCVAPGATWTHAGAAHESLQNGGIPMGRLGTPKDVADLVAYLISDAAWMIDGFQVRIDGGLILSGLPEGWADAKFINPAWVQENYEKVMNMTGN